MRYRPSVSLDQAGYLPIPIDFVTVFDAILTSRQTREKLQSVCMRI